MSVGIPTFAAVLARGMRLLLTHIPRLCENVAFSYKFFFFSTINIVDDRRTH